MLFALIRILSTFVPDERIKYSRDGLSHRISILFYTIYCLISGSLQFPTFDSYRSALYEAPLEEYASFGVTADQREFFFMISGFEIADGIIRCFHGTFTNIHIIHHALHLIAYMYGGLIWKQYGWGFLVHLILCEWRDIVVVMIRLLNQIRITRSYRMLHYFDVLCVVVINPFLWKFAYNVCMVRDIDMVYKVSIIAYGVMLAKWFKDRLQWNWKKIQRDFEAVKSQKLE